ncbi:hypothetical protein [Gorillibacterium massiliense]|uniref:hypothetical protein n=1 Tax=Gorillibacterium massiliense TaxID=1280390 RepID=UPI0004B1AFF0|nr:hypothetical protein [Gorillibacterium massiliense]
MPSACTIHWNGNTGGAVKLFTQALHKLAPYPADALGIDLGKLRRESESYLEALRLAVEKGDSGSHPFRPIDIIIIDPILRKQVEEWDKPEEENEEDGKTG